MDPEKLPIRGGPSDVHSNQGNPEHVSAESDKGGHHYLLVNNKSGDFKLTKD